MTEKTDSTYEFIQQSPLFVGLSEKAISRLIDLAEIQAFASGEVVVAEGDVGDSFFLLYDGVLSVSTRSEAGEEVELLKMRERGAFFGEVVVVDPGPRSATVKAESEAVLLKVPIGALERFFAEFKEAESTVLRNIARVLAQRLRGANIRFSLHS